MRREFKECPNCRKRVVVLYSYRTNGENHYKLACGCEIIEEKKASEPKKPTQGKQGGLL